MAKITGSRFLIGYTIQQHDRALGAFKLSFMLSDAVHQKINSREQRRPIMRELTRLPEICELCW